MENKPTSANSKTNLPPGNDKTSVIKALTRLEYKRLPETQRQIESASNLDPPSLIQRAHERDESHPNFLSAEALVYFIRNAERNGDRKSLELLFRELLERCTPFFRGKFLGFNDQDREDLINDVLKKVVEDALASDDRGDYMQVRFWKYLNNKVIDACRVAPRQNENTESLDENVSDDGPEGMMKHEVVADNRLSTEELTIIAHGLSKLPSKLRKVYLLRHYVGMNIGSDNPESDDPNKPTLAQHFGCTGRTIRSWLKEAEDLLVGFRKENT